MPLWKNGPVNRLLPLFPHWCSNIRHRRRNNNPLFLRCLLHHYRGHLQIESQFFLTFRNLLKFSPFEHSLIRISFKKMGGVSNKQQRIYNCFRMVFGFVVVVGFSVAAAHQCNHHHDHLDDHNHHHDHVHHDGFGVGVVKSQQQLLLPEELAETEDLKLYGFGLHHSHNHEREHKHGDIVELSGLGKHFPFLAWFIFLKKIQLHCDLHYISYGFLESLCFGECGSTILFGWRETYIYILNILFQFPRLVYAG